MFRNPLNGQDRGFHYNIADQGDVWIYDGILGAWSPGSNTLKDNLEEHNDFDLFGWSDTLMPGTQCGHTPPSAGEAITDFTGQNLCLPIGATGGN